MSLESTSDRSLDKSAVRLLITLLIVAGIALVFVLWMYFKTFGPTISDKQELWGQFGDYMGGTLNPILAYLSFVALIMTLAIQTRQLDLSREQLRLSRAELHATREELKRTADAQASSAASLHAQVIYAATSAKVSAVSAALRATDDELDRLRGMALVGGQAARMIADLNQRRDDLLRQLNDLSDSIK